MSEQTPIETRVAVNGIELALFEWPGAADKANPPILFLHATGFHGRVWDDVIRNLPGRHCYAPDLRGHGRSSKPAPPDGYVWRAFADDIVGLIESLDLRGAIGVGHSLGGHTLTQAAARAPGHFAKLMLIDPVIIPREGYGVRFTGADYVARRRDSWDSPAQMIDRLTDRVPYDRWRPAVLRDYCEYGLLPNPSGDGFVLACPPRIEAAIYPNHTLSDIYDLIPQIDVPVHILRAERKPPDAAYDFSSSPTAPDLASHFKRGHDEYLPAYSHFIPMEAPALIAARIESLIAAK